jgi:hypothetical protein
METTDRGLKTSVPLVALLGWILPGAGYWLIGQRGRALCSGISILVLWILGLLIAGVRVIEVPGYQTANGERVMSSVLVQAVDPRTGRPEVDEKGSPVYAPAREPGTNLPMKQWVMQVSPLNEIRDKPWSVPQAMAGPIAIASGMLSVYADGEDASTRKLDPDTNQPIPGSGKSIGELSHARINEIGSLYLSVAGLLNLMIIIDSSWRASHLGQHSEEQPAEAAA